MVSQAFLRHEVTVNLETLFNGVGWDRVVVLDCVFETGSKCFACNLDWLDCDDSGGVREDLAYDLCIVHVAQVFGHIMLTILDGVKDRKMFPTGGPV